MKQSIKLEKTYLDLIQEILLNFLPGDSRVWIFGSRANGVPKSYSDIDLAIDIGQRMSLDLLSAKLQHAFEESNLPYKVDVIDWNNISDAFRENIKQQRIAILS